MDTKKVTVLIIGNDDEEVRSYSVNASLIKNFKRYLIKASIVCAVFFLIVGAIITNSLRLSLNNSNLSSQVNLMNRQLETYDSIKLSQKLSTIDGNLFMINSYLNERGLFGTGNAGGEPVSRDKGRTNVEKIDYFEKESVVFYQTLRDLPVGYPYIGEQSSGYGSRRNPFGGSTGEFHPGIDFKGETGDPVYATGDGVINRCDWYAGYGNAVVIDHKSGYQSLFGHLSRVNVYQGQNVKAGDLIGFVGSTGRSTGSHLHYEIRKNGDDINPEPFFKLY